VVPDDRGSPEEIPDDEEPSEFEVTGEEADFTEDELGPKPRVRLKERFVRRASAVSLGDIRQSLLKTPAMARVRQLARSFCARLDLR